METLTDAIDKRFSKSLLLFLKLVDPERTCAFDKNIVEAWNRLTLDEQRRLYLYLLYRKWRGDGFYGTPLDIVEFCHPQPFNWNGRPMLNRLMKETKMVRAFYNGNYGIYTADEARVWNMTELQPLN